MGVLVLDWKKYMAMLASGKPVAQMCTHCGATTFSFSGNPSFCNFCEQYVEVNAATEAQTPFAAVRTSIDSNDVDSALKSAEQLMKGNKDPEQLYLLGVFYLNLSTAMFQNRNYNLKGFMEANANNIRSSLDLTMRWKECFFKVIKIVDSELQANLQIDPALVLLKFMCEIRLRRLVDASIALRELQTLDKRSFLSEYALLVYGVEKGTREAEASLQKALGAKEVNAFFYLAKYLAKHNKLSEAEQVLLKLGQIARVSMSDELLYRIRLAREASKM
jgi:uncharacterized Zn finger protein (UPF0148 family)